MLNMLLSSEQNVDASVWSVSILKWKSCRLPWRYMRGRYFSSVLQQLLLWEMSMQRTSEASWNHSIKVMFVIFSFIHALAILAFQLQLQWCSPVLLESSDCVLCCLPEITAVPSSCTEEKTLLGEDRVREGINQ